MLCWVWKVQMVNFSIAAYENHDTHDKLSMNENNEESRQFYFNLNLIAHLKYLLQSMWLETKNVVSVI